MSWQAVSEHYTVDRLARAHLSALKALERTSKPGGPDPFTDLMTADHDADSGRGWPARAAG